MKKLIGTGAAVLALAVALSPAAAMEAAKRALALCAGTLIPSLFPFFVCANILVSSGMTASAGRLFEKTSKRLFGVGGEGAAAVLLGLISGYPAGAAVTCRLYTAGSISKGEAARLLAFTNNAGPLFVIGVIGTGVYHTPNVGYILLAAQALAALATGVCMRFYGKNEPLARRKERKAASDPMGDAVHTVLSLCGFVVFFAVVAAFAEKVGFLAMLRHLFSLAGAGEKTADLLSAGLFEISAAAEKEGAALPAMAGILSFGGLSVLLQTASIVRKAGLSMKSYIIGKILSAGLAAFFCRLLLAAFLQTVTVSASVFPEKAVFYTGYLGLAAVLSVGVYLLYVLLCKFCK